LLPIQFQTNGIESAFFLNYESQIAKLNDITLNQIKDEFPRKSQHDEANNVTYQRCQYAYEYAKPFITGKKVLDVGCGNAYGTALMAESASEIMGLDYDQSTIDDNKDRYSTIKNLSFKRAEIPPLPFEDNSFDVVTAFQFIEHIHARKEFMKECLRVLKPGGKVMITTPNSKKIVSTKSISCS
jgi:ubiquinone/menaquinone biosynthesis C-methylase UbiE